MARSYVVAAAPRVYRPISSRASVAQHRCATPLRNTVKVPFDKPKGLAEAPIMLMQNKQADDQAAPSPEGKRAGIEQLC